MLKVTDSQGNIRDITKVIKTGEVLPEYKADRHGTEEILSSGKSVSPILSINYEGTRQDAEFTYRQTGGGTLIEDIEKANVEKVKGNTVAWNQLIRNGNFSTGITNWFVTNGTTNTASGVCDITLTITPVHNYDTLIGQNVKLILNHKYYVSISCKCPHSGTFRIDSNFAIPTIEKSVVQNAWEKISAIKTSERDGLTPFNFYPLLMSDRYAQGDTFSIKNAQVFDLTLIYGAGNEPTSVAQFEADYQRWFGKPLTYEEYDAGSLRPVNMTGIKSVCFNQWDEEWESGSINPANGNLMDNPNKIRPKNFISVLPNTTYYYNCKPVNDSCHIVYYDSNKIRISNKAVQRNAVWGTYTTPANCHYMKFNYLATTYNHDICINISDPAKDGTYEPYIEEVKEFDVTTLTGKLNGAGSSVTIFPDGMKKAGRVYDEIKVEDGVIKAIKRVGSRAYASGDESDTSVITDGNTTTFYELATPEEYVLDIPMKEISVINHTDSNGNIRQVLVGN